MQPFTGVLPITPQAGLTGGSVLVGGWGHQSAGFLLGCRQEPQSQQGLKVGVGGAAEPETVQISAKEKGKGPALES